VTAGYYQLSTGRVAALDSNGEAHCAFPPSDSALSEPNGLIAIGGDLSAARLLSAYKQGIFPWYNEGEPIMWWSPNPRMVLFPDELKISTSLKKTLKKNLFEVRFNTAFREVMTACSQTPRGEHNLGYAMSMESWLDNQLIGGCYGIKIGHMFYGESMFHTQTDASKIAFVHLVNYLKNQGVGMIDCQMKTALLASFGGREIERGEFAIRLKNLINLAA
jgi:leucyl/phenylalanyl-tRNA---protein transferase